MNASGKIFYFDWEPALMAWIQAHLNTFGVKFFAFCSDFGEELILVGLLCFLYFWYNKEGGKYVGVRLMLAGVLYSQIKNIACRLRPYFVHDDINILKPVDKNADLYDIAAQGYSFPSGHSANSSSAFLSLAYYFKKNLLTIVCIIITAFVGISRFCLGAHYPTDVLVGWTIGIISLFGIGWLEKLCRKKWIMYLVLAAIGLPGIFFCTTQDYFTSYGMMIGFFCADYFEMTFVKFSNTKNPVRGILRILGGAGLYLGLNAMLKLPFSSEFLANGSFASNMVRCCRYMIVMFVTMGVYPLLFKYTAKIGAKKS